MSSYTTLKTKHQKEVDDFPIGFAFNNKQFDEAMEKLGLKPNHTKAVCSIGAGGFIRKTDKEAFFKMFERHHKEMDEAIAADETGEGFIFDMFDYELANHEYGYTGEYDDTLNALDLTWKEIENDPRLKHGLDLASQKQRQSDCWN